jgi:hypothetical protein
MAQAQRYQFEQRSGGRGAVVRIGPTGGKKVINVYKTQDAAMDVVNILNQYKSSEA